MSTLKAYAEWLDTQLRFADLDLQRMHGSPLNHRLQVQRHTVDAFVWPSLVAGALWTGMPTLGPHLLGGVLVTIITGCILIALARCTFRHAIPVWWDMRLQTLFLLGLGGLLWSIGSETVQDWRPYRHALLLVTAIVSASLFVAVWIIQLFLAPLRNKSQYSDFLQETELFQRRVPERPATGLAVVVQMGVSALFNPLPWLFPAALLAVVMPADSFRWWTVVVGCIGFLISLLAGLDERLEMMLSLFTARLFRNVALAISLFLIVLGILRWSNFTYVTTILDTIAGAEIFLYLCFIYAVTWWYDYWVDRLLGQELLRFLDPTATTSSVIPYPLLPAKKATAVPYDKRVVQIHGLGRFLVYRASAPDVPGDSLGFQTRPWWRQPPYPYFHSWTYRDFFYQLAATGAPGGTHEPLPRQIDQRIGQCTKVIGGLVVGLLALSAYGLGQTMQEPELEVQSDRPALISLAHLLATHDQTRPQWPVLLVAASGGGTRAALYTAAVLEALVVAGFGQDVLLGSGVSGGGASLAYFASKRLPLTENDRTAWDAFFATMAQPFIQDVLERASEWRMTRGGRLGNLLAESFQRRWGLAVDRDQLGDIEDFGLILNTALAAHFERPDATSPGIPEPLRQVARLYAQHTRSELAGGRLILTNLAIRDAFKDANLPLNLSQPLPIVIDDREVRLAYAAALSANFPPVFPNAAVDVDNKVRYWVTDGGAADNRGMEMLAYTLRYTLHKCGTRLRCQNLPRFHMVVLDASAVEASFQQDRGIGTALSAGTQFASHLVAELVHRLQECYQTAKQANDFQFHYVPMPRILHGTGSFGTHWMLQKWIRVTHDKESVTIAGQEMIAVLRALYSGDSAPALSSEATKVLAWGKMSREYTGAWKHLMQSLAVPHAKAAQ